MSSSFPRLLGDVGGTHARWAWQANPEEPLRDIRVFRVADHATIAASAAAYLAASGHRAPAAAAIGVATPVTGDLVRFTNSPWSFSTAELQRSLGVSRCLVLNDFTALALSLPALAATDRRALGGGEPVAGAPLALIGPGTGLGVSGLVADAAGGWSALAGEGGHVTLAAADDDEAAVIAVLRRRFGHVSAERVLSGQGLVNLHDAARELAGEPPCPRSPAEVAGAAASDPASAAALRLFAGFLGTVAGNLVLTLGARGGVYVGGGVVPKLGAAFDADRFRVRFEAKGRFSDYLRAVPCWLITAATPGLLGAARALDRAHD